MPRYTIEPGRIIKRDGLPYIVVSPAVEMPAWESDQLIARLCELLNKDDADHAHTASQDTPDGD